jgi:RND superfamily putative drug exporter
MARVGVLIGRRPRRVLAAWLVVVAVLSLVGLGLEDKLFTRAIYLDGTPTKEEHQVAVRAFGHENSVVVMLRGPRKQVEEQGRRLEARFEALPRSVVFSPWGRGGSIEGLRPRPGVAALLVDLEGGADESLLEILPLVRERVDEAVGGQVEASIAGAPAIVDSIQKASMHAAEVGQWIAIPALLIVLLLVFRSVLAAVTPVLVGGSVVLASRGVLDLLAGIVHLDVLALGAMGMMGLALGVDYALLVVSRFREELAGGASVPEAVENTVTVTGRTVLMAGSGLCLAMAVASQLLPGEIVTSVALAVIVASLLSVSAAILVVPAILAVLGPNLDRWSLPRRPGERSWAARLSAKLSARPRAAALPLVFILVFAAAWAFSLDTGVATVALLPEGDPGRGDQEAVQRELGPGWVAPIEIIMHDPDGPVTTSSRLTALADFQHRVERDPGVAAVTGFGRFARASRKLTGFDEGLERQQRGLDRLGRGLGQAHKGATLNTEGLFRAAGGAGKLGTALGATDRGAGALAGGLKATSSGSSKLIDGIGKAGDGSAKLADGAADAGSGAGRLSDGLERARRQTGGIERDAKSIEDAISSGEERLDDEVEPPAQNVEERLSAAAEALHQMTVGRSDPRYADVLEQIEVARLWLTGVDPATGEESEQTNGVVGGLESARSQFNLSAYLAQRLGRNGEKASVGMKKLADGSAKLDDGLEKLATGTRKLSVGIARLSRHGQILPPALRQLEDGAGKLASGLGKIQLGAGSLADGLGSGAQKSRQLGSALGKMHSGLDNAGEGGLGSLDRRSPGLFDSGYFFLASLDGSKPEQRSKASFLISVDRGGSAARMLVIPSYDPGDPRAAAATGRLTDMTRGLAARTGTDVLVGGITPSQLDVNEALRRAALPTRLALALVTALVLILVLRSLLIPFLAALLNVLTVAATFGFLALLFDGSLLGGPGYVDAAVLPATIMVVFGLAIDYEVFIFSRMREEYLRTGSSESAVAGGLARTAPVVTGAAIIMIVVFLAFAVSPFATMRNFGVAQAIGVAIDAFMIRLIIVPAMMRALGPWAWWMPAWLDRLLPGTPNSVVRRAGEGTA